MCSNPSTLIPQEVTICYSVLGFLPSFSQSTRLDATLDTTISTPLPEGELSHFSGYLGLYSGTPIRRRLSTVFPVECWFHQPLGSIILGLFVSFDTHTVCISTFVHENIASCTPRCYRCCKGWQRVLLANVVSIITRRPRSGMNIASAGMRTRRFYITGKPIGRFSAVCLSFQSKSSVAHSL